MEKKKRKPSVALRGFFAALLAAALAIFVYESQVFEDRNNQFSDQMFQESHALDGNIFILGIDAHSLDELGPYQTWSRDYVAEAIRLLNKNPETRPAVIGVDILYPGYTNEEADKNLVEACSLADNVVVGTQANFSNELVVTGGKARYIKNVVSLYEEPFEELKNVTKQGVVTGCIDGDGVIRRGLSYLSLPDGRQVESFSYQVYRQYAEEYGLIKDPAVPLDSNGHWYIAFSSKAGGYDNGYSLSDFIQGEISPDQFAGCIVLIGAYAEGLQDSYKTAIDYAAPMHGVEVHANMVDALLQRKFKREIPRLAMAGVIGTVTFLCVFIFYQCKVWYAFSGAVILGIGYPFLAKALYDRGLILDLIFIPSIGILCFFEMVLVHYIRIVRARRQVLNTFKRYVAPQVVDEIMRKGMDTIELGGQLTDIACLFVDIRGFTPMSEALSPPQVVEVLNRYLELTSSCIFKHHGTLDKFIGDATMAIFNAPLPQEDYVYQAVLTAWDMVQGSKALGEELKERFGRYVSFGIGVHCGKAVVGNIGTERRLDYTAIGDTVNTAARLESNAKPGTILISREVYEVVKDRVKAVSLGTSIKLKGKSDGFEIFMVEDVTEG